VQAKFERGGRRDIKAASDRRRIWESALGKMVRSNLPELPNITCTVMIHLVLNGKDMVLAPKQLQALYTDVRHWEELVDFIDKNGGPKEPYILT
jgi:hypothetical protein